MTWKRTAGEELSKFDLRIVIVFAIACAVIVSYEYYVRFPFDIVSGRLPGVDGETLILCRSIGWHLGTFFMLSVVPFAALVILNRFSSRKLSPARYTFTLGDYKAGFVLVAFFVVVTVSVHLILSSFGVIPVDIYPACKSELIRKYVWVFLLFELTQSLYMVGFEYFFRGFLLFEAEALYGYNALAVTLLPYIMIKLGKPPVEIYTAIPVGVALGYMTIRTRSFAYAALSHCLLATSVDLISLY